MDEEFNKMMREVERNNSIDRSSNPKQWVSNWLKLQDITIYYNERIKWAEYPDASMRLLIEYLIESYYCAMESMNVKKSDRFTDGDLRRGLYLCIVDIQRAHKKQFLNSIRYDNTIDPGLSELKKFCNTIFEDPEFAFYNIQHFMWQVKRKIFNQKVTNHMMLIVFGDQGCGKTEAIEKLLSPLKDYVYEGQISAVQDKNEFHNFNSNYVMRCEELERLDKTDKNALKSMITRETVPYRILYSQMTAVVDQNCTFIGTSNDNISDIFKDYSGMRRFVQLNAKSEQKLSKNDGLGVKYKEWAIINSINYDKIWKSIAHSSKSPIVPLLNNGLMKEHQSELTAKNSIQEWIEETELKDGPREIEVDVLYNLYKSWCFSIKATPFRPRKFSTELTNNGFEKARIRKEGRRVYVVKCNLNMGE